MSRHDLYTESGGPAVPEFRIGLAPIPVEHWFEGGEADPAARKDALFTEHPTLVWGEVEGSCAGQAEIAGLIREWLTLNPAHPREGGDSDGSATTSASVGGGLGRVPAFAGMSGLEVLPLLAAARAVSDDLCLMEKRSGEWTLTAASLCAPSFFSAEEVVGKQLSGLHAPVPGFNDSLLPRVARIFDHLQPDQVLERRNWTVVNDPELFQPDPAPFRARLPHQTLDEIAASLHVRRERQTLRKAPNTGAVLFTIRIWRERLDDLLADPERHAGFAAAWNDVMSDRGAAFRTYKRLDLYDAAIRKRLSAPS
jgi:hypothetical protein